MWAGKGIVGIFKLTNNPLSRPHTIFNSITIVISNEVRNLFFSFK